MIAIIGYPGERKHTWKRFQSKADAQAWLDDTVEVMCARHPAASAPLRLSARIIPEKAAAKMRYRDGRKCYPLDPETEYYAEVPS